MNRFLDEQNDKNSTNSKKKSEKSNNSKMKSIPSTALEEVKEVDEKVEVVKSKKTHLMPPCKKLSNLILKNSKKIHFFIQIAPKKQQRGSINLRPRASMKMIPNDEFQGRKNKISKRPVGRRSKKRKTTGDSSITNLLQIIKSTRNLIKKGEDQTLKMIHMDVSLMIKPGQKVCFIGRHNSGCSEVLLTIRGETKITQGKLRNAENFKNSIFSQNSKILNFVIFIFLVRRRSSEIVFLPEFYAKSSLSLSK